MIFSSRVNKLRLMPEYHCFPLWEDGNSEFGNVDPATLPITSALQLALMEWASRYDATLNQEYPPDSAFSSKEEERHFVADGSMLLQRLQDELGDGYVIRLQI